MGRKLPVPTQASPEVLYFVIDSLGMDAGTAFVYLDPYRKQVDDPRLDGRFSSQDGKVSLETYSSRDIMDLPPGTEEFASVFILAQNRRMALVRLVRQLGYTSKVEIKREKE